MAKLLGCCCDSKEYRCCRSGKGSGYFVHDKAKYEMLELRVPCRQCFNERYGCQAEMLSLQNLVDPWFQAFVG